MARRSNAARLPEGTTLLDFATPGAILRAFEGDERRIRAEYSRQRSIVRKRIERMAAAGETENFVYRKYGDLKSALPTADRLSTRQMLDILTSTASTIGGGYQSTLRDIKKRRQRLRKTIEEQEQKGEAKVKTRGKGKKATAEDESADEGDGGKLSDAQLRKIQKLMGMTQFVLGKARDSGELLEMVTDTVRRGGGKRNLLSMAAEILNAYGAAETEDLEGLKSRFTAKGTTRVSWAKAHGKRGK